MQRSAETAIHTDRYLAPTQTQALTLSDQLPLALITHKPYRTCSRLTYLKVAHFLTVHYRWPFTFRMLSNRQVEEERIKECVPVLHSAPFTPHD